jgi:hypothetical protein
MQRSLSEINFNVGIWQHACQDLQFGLSNFNLPSIVSLLSCFIGVIATLCCHCMSSHHNADYLIMIVSTPWQHRNVPVYLVVKDLCTFLDCFSFLKKEWFWSECMDIYCPPVSSSHGTWSSEIPTSSFRACGSFYLRCKWKLNKFLLVLETLIHAVS